MYCYSVRMTTVEAVLRRHGYAMSEQTLAAHLDALLSAPQQDNVGIDMSATDAAYLAQYSGVQDASDADLALDQACRRVVSTGLKGKGLTLPGFATPTQPSGKGLCGEEDIA